MKPTEERIVNYLRGRDGVTTLRDVCRNLSRKQDYVLKQILPSTYIGIDPPPEPIRKAAPMIPHGERRVWLVEVEEAA